jgi:hypothetical protein
MVKYCGIPAQKKGPIQTMYSPRGAVISVAEQWSSRHPNRQRFVRLSIGVLVGAAIVSGSIVVPALRDAGFESLGPVSGIALVVFSLFGDLPSGISWAQRLGSWLVPGIAAGTILLLLPLLIATRSHQSSFLAFSPTVWAAYISIVLVGISFGSSDLPERVYAFCKRLNIGPAVFVPIFVIVAGLLGNILDGVSIVAISVIILLSLLERTWAVTASFALLFGGLISNLITVAAEPTNIKFQDVLHGLLDQVTPSYWLSNWPISVFGILFPALWLGYTMHRSGASWRAHEPDATQVFGQESRQALPVLLSALSLILLASGIVAHAAFQASASAHDAFPLWALLLPAGIVAVLHLRSVDKLHVAGGYIRHEWPVWGKLMIIFSLLWLLSNAVSAPTNIFGAFFTWSDPVRYGLMIVLSLLSSVTDNVALAAMQGSLLLSHPLAIWQIRLLFILLTWAGGFTPFGCLQSLALNSRLQLSTGAWFRQALAWAALALAGGMLGLALISILYPSA